MYIYPTNCGASRLNWPTSRALIQIDFCSELRAGQRLHGHVPYTRPLQERSRTADGGDARAECAPDDVLEAGQAADTTLPAAFPFPSSYLSSSTSTIPFQACLAGRRRRSGLGRSRGRRTRRQFVVYPTEGFSTAPKTVS